jgi:hypothetical protein
MVHHSRRDFMKADMEVGRGLIPSFTLQPAGDLCRQLVISVGN